MTLLEIKHSTAPFTVELRGGTALLSSKGREGSGGFRPDRDTPWIDFAEFVVQLDGCGKPNPTGVANLNLFRAAPGLLQVAIAFVHEHGKRGGVYDQLLPADQQSSMVREAMRAVETALSGEMP